MKFLRPFLFAAATLLTPTHVFAAAEADLLVAFDNSYYDGVGGEDNAQVLTANSVAHSNLVNDRSGTGARMRITGYHATTAQGGRSTLGGYVGWMANYGDGNLDDVTAAADARGADLVAFICAPGSGEGSAAVAQQPGRYAAYGPGNFWTNIVAHETGGHNYGCAHEGCRTNPTTIMMHNYCGGGSQGFFSNPNIWLNGVQLHGGMNLGACTFVGGADNAYHISTQAQGVADRNARVIASPNLGAVVRRWKFNQGASNAPAGTTVLDEVSGTALATVQGTGATFTGDGLRLPGGASGSGAAYVQLPTALISGLTNVTIEIWAKTLSVRNWARILDFNNGTSNYIMLSSSVGTDLWFQRFDSTFGGTSVQLDSNLPTETGVWHHYAITYTSTGASTGRWRWFRDGERVAYLDVNYALSSLQDVNNWLGRSAFGSDALANAEYAEVRISSAALSRDEVMANFSLGPNRASAGVTLTADDPNGQTSFNAAGRWSDGLAPSAGKTYETYRFRLRTPADGTSRSFAGGALTLTGGSFTWKGTSSSTITVNNLTLGGADGEVLNAGSGTFTLAGNLNVAADETLVRAANGPINLSANLSGKGALLCTNSTVTLSGTNTAFTGKVIVGDGRFSGLSINSEARLGANPATFSAGHLTLNRGVLFTNTTMTIDDANRGIRVGVSAGVFNVAPGTTLTIAVPIAGASSGDALVTAPLFPNPVSGLFIKENTGTLVLTHPNNSHIGELLISGGELRLDGAGRINNGDQHMPTTINGTLNLNTTADQILGGVISGGGTFLKNNSGTTSLYGANTFTGSVTVNAGTLFARASNAATNRNFSHVSGITVNSGATLRSDANSLFGWDGTQAKPITVNAGGILTTDAANDDVNVGTITLNGGTLAGFASPAWGSWSFKRASGGKIVVTENSAVTAPNVSIGSNNTVEVAAGKTLTWSGAITDLSSEGVCALVKDGGTGTLLLTGTNTYTGATTLNTGTTIVNGSLGTASAVSVASGATLAGTGTVGGSLTFAANAIHAPGNTTGIGTQTVSGVLDYAASSRVKWTLLTNSDATGAASRIAAATVNVTAGAVIDLVLNGAGSTTNYFDTFWTQPRSWTVLSASAMNGTFTLGAVSGDSGSRAAANCGIFSLSQGATGVTLHWTPKPYTAWRGAKFGANAVNATISDFLANPDGDGFANAWEYFYDTDPNVGTSSALQTQTLDGRFAVVFPRNTVAADVTATVRGADAPDGPWTDLARSTGGDPFTALVVGVMVNETGAGSTRTVDVRDLYLISDPAHPRRFFRLSLEPQ